MTSFEEPGSGSSYQQTRQKVGWIPRPQAKPETYHNLGFKSGLEIHQQLKTAEKLFCRCPAGLYQAPDDFDAEVIRHMRPTLSEMGEYDGTALMEMRTKKNIVYRLKDQTACTYEIDDTPPFKINSQAVDIAIEISLMLNLNIVGELHITRKQYLDGSIPTGFQRTAIVGIEGDMPLGDRKIRIIQLSVEEDSCREVSDIGHWRVYRTDRLGMPLIETVTYPDMLTPDEVAEVCHYLRFVARASGKVRTGIGTAREDVNVSIQGGTRVEIKGVAHIKWIPDLAHNEAFRQKAMLVIADELKERVADTGSWRAQSLDLDFDDLEIDYAPLREARSRNERLTLINLPQFSGLLSHFTQPGQTFANELSQRLKVISCLEHPNMLHSENEFRSAMKPEHWKSLCEKINASENDAQILVWGPSDDVATAIETIDERCQLAFLGVPNETRKSLPDGTTIFERVLPGPDRMYPDTDSAPIPIKEERIEKFRSQLPPSVADRIQQLSDWKIPKDTHRYLLRNNLTPLVERIVNELDFNPMLVGTLLGHRLRHEEGRRYPGKGFSYEHIYKLFKFVRDKTLHPDILKELIPLVYNHPEMSFDELLAATRFEQRAQEDILAQIPALMERFSRNGSGDPDARKRWIMGELRKEALGNVSMRDLSNLVDEAVAHV